MAPKEVKNQLDILLKEYLGKEQLLLDKLTKEERSKIGKPIKNISQLDDFTANGNKYIIRTSLTVSRFEQFEQLQVKVGFGVDSRNMFTNIRKAYGYLNQMKPADGAVILYNMMNGIKDHLEDRENEVLELCALFICREGENVADYDAKLNKSKIEDWKKEGIAMEDFFTLAFNLVNNFTPIYQEVSGSISEHLEKVQESINPLKEKKST